MGKKEKESNLTNELIDVGEVVPKEKIKEFLVKEWFIIKSYSEGKISIVELVEQRDKLIGTGLVDLWKYKPKGEGE